MNITDFPRRFRPVILESPYAGNLKRNLRYARAAMRDCLLRWEAPFASHLLYTQENVLSDDDPIERKLGIQAGFEWRRLASATVVYIDLGVTEGMRQGIRDSERRSVPVEIRNLKGWAL